MLAEGGQLSVSVRRLNLKKWILLGAAAIGALALVALWLLQPSFIAFGTFTHTKTEYFTIELPANWRVSKIAASSKGSDGYEYVDFDVVSPESKRALTVTVASDGPRYIACFCAPDEDYEKYEIDGVKYADLHSWGREHRTLKAAGKLYGIDVHLDYDDFNDVTLNRIVESIRPF